MPAVYLTQQVCEIEAFTPISFVLTKTELKDRTSRIFLENEFIKNIFYRIDVLVRDLRD